MADEEIQEAGGKGATSVVKIIIIVTVAIALITVSAFVAYKVAETVKNPVGQTQNTAENNQENNPEPREIFVVGEIKTVVRGKNLKAIISLGYDKDDNPELAEELPKRLSELKHLYNTIFFSLDPEKLEGSNLPELTERFRLETNRRLRHGQIAEVYFEEYVFTG